MGVRFRVSGAGAVTRAAALFMETNTRTPVVKPGDIVEGRYKVLRSVDEGGMGSVFLAEHVLIHRRVALKILHPELASDGVVIERFMNEARAAGTLGHPNIVESTDMGFTREGVPYIVFEYLEGTLLTDEIYRLGRLSVRRALKIAEQIASALAAAHHANIVHRDLKSDNVYLTDKDDVPDHVKVLDFGISRLDGATDHSEGVIGTPEYMAPEQVTRPDAVDHRADIYALGVILYEMLCGRVPFSTTGDRSELVHRIVHDEPPPIDRPDAPPGLAEMILTKLLAKDPGRRYQTMKTVLGALEAFRSVTRPTAPPRSKRATDAGVGALAATTGKVPVLAIAEPRRDKPSTPPIVGEVQRPPAALLAPSARNRGRARIGWLVAAAVVGAGAGVLTYLDGQRPRTAVAPAAAVGAVEGAADKVAGAIESVVRGAQLRADGLAATPMLRAAIETDAATLVDMSQGDMVLAINPGETLEIFQHRGNATTSLLRLPTGASALPPPADHRPGVGADDGAVRVRVSAAVVGYRPEVSGTVALEVPVDLAAARGKLPPETLSATLVGLPSPVALTADRGAAGVEIRAPVAMPSDLAAGGLAVIARVPAPRRDDSLVLPRNACLAASGGLVGIYALSLLLARRRR